jgi:hypothetical protein
MMQPLGYGITTVNPFTGVAGTWYPQLRHAVVQSKDWEEAYARRAQVLKQRQSLARRAKKREKEEQDDVVDALISLPLSPSLPPRPSPRKRERSPSSSPVLSPLPAPLQALETAQNLHCSSITPLVCEPPLQTLRRRVEAVFPELTGSQQCFLTCCVPACLLSCVPSRTPGTTHPREFIFEKLGEGLYESSPGGRITFWKAFHKLWNVKEGEPQRTANGGR